MRETTSSPETLEPASGPGLSSLVCPWEGVPRVGLVMRGQGQSGGAKGASWHHSCRQAPSAGTPGTAQGSAKQAHGSHRPGMWLHLAQTRLTQPLVFLGEEGVSGERLV